MRELALEALEVATTPKEVWEIISSINADLDDKDVLFHLGCNPTVSYGDMERWLATGEGLSPEEKGRERRVKQSIEEHFKKLDAIRLQGGRGSYPPFWN